MKADAHAIDQRVSQALGRCFLGLVLIVIALALEAALWAHTPPSPFLLVYPAVIVAAWVGNWTAGLTAIIVASMALPYWFLPPLEAFSVAARRDALDLGLFICIALVLVFLIVRVKETLVETRAAQEVAEKATAAKDTVLAVVAHDLRNPLQTIGLSAELLSTDRSGSEALASERVNRIYRAAERARRLVDNILDTARLDSTPLPVVRSVVSLASLIDESVAPFKPLAGARHIELELPPDEALAGSVSCDRDRVVQVLSNLVGNALHFTPAGGRIAVQVWRDPRAVHFEVADTGMGMTKDDLSHAFEKLWHGKCPGHGSGLGLWISRALVEAHGGKIEATSEPGLGTRMTFFIPQPVPDTSPETSASNESPPLAHAGLFARPRG